MKPTEDQVNEQLNRAADGIDHGTHWPGMSYEQGVDAALRWAMGWTDEVPMEDE